MIKKTFISLFCFGLLTGPGAQAGEDGKNNLAWLRDFFAKGIMSAHAQYSQSIGADQNSSDNYFKRMSYSVDFIFAEKKYNYRFIYEYADSWSVLTNENTEAPPKQTEFFVGSEITPWREQDGVGSYREEFTKTLPNWFVFDDLDSIVILQCDIQNPIPPITGLFYADEFKALKRLRKTAVSNNQPEGIWTCFEYDESGNVAEISRVYLSALNSKNLLTHRLFEDYTITVRNNSNDAVFVDVLIGTNEHELLEGLCFRQGDKKVNIFNLEMNSLFHKFTPELVSDPRILIQLYLGELQKESTKCLDRFETSRNN